MTALDDRLNSAEPAPAPVDPSAAARVIAYYLPQYHPIPENDAWWGRGFTEWTNVTKARRRFPGHYQPRLAGELGYYDLRVPEVRAQQAELAREHGVEAFCYYHYWFGTSELLQRPLAEVVASGQPGLSFCVCWANETWTGIWHGNPRQTLIEQTYPGDGDHRRHFESLRPAFEDRRYLRVDGKPVFVVYKPNQVPDAARVCDLWREMAVMAGLGGLHLVGVKNSLEGAPLPPGSMQSWRRLFRRWHAVSGRHRRQNRWHARFFGGWECPRSTATTGWRQASYPMCCPTRGTRA